MRTVRLSCVVAVVLLTAVAAQVAAKYQTGTVLEVTKLPDQHSNEGPNPPLVFHIDRYELKVQVGEKVYKVALETMGGSNLDWVKGKKFDMRIARNVLYAKTDTGNELKLSILGTASSKP